MTILTDPSMNDYSAYPDVLAVQFLGMTVHAFTWQRLKDAITDAVEHRRRWVISHHNLHSAYFYHNDGKVLEFYNCSEWVHIDGMSLIFLGRLLGLPLTRAYRLTHLDWIRPLLAEAAQRNWRVFYLGSRPGIAARGAEILRRENPSLALET